MDDRLEAAINNRKEIECFFKDAFCAETAKVIINPEFLNLKVSAVVKIETEDRGTFFIGYMEST